MNRIAKAVAAFGLAAAMAGAASCMTPVNSSATTGTLKGSQIGSSTSSFGTGSHSSAGSPSSTGTVAGGTIDASQSQALSDYLKHHQLPLVGGQVVNSTSGGRQVILFGFVASDFGKTDAEQKARNYLKDPTLVVDNRIKVSAELGGDAQASGSRPGNAESPTADSNDPYGGAGSIQDYENSQQMDPYAYQAQQSQQNGAYSSSASTMMTALQILGVFGSIAGGSGGFHSSYGGFSSGYAPSYGNYGYPSYPPYPSGSGFGPP
jgi:hypothetical protein